ncbi:hypothetical protein EVJ58_g10082 [Rhodofomes roseus]|uniref:Uncharacterized protein n=1 Tax=Rhodofomes roseus TaxID=34475 RepID=A0A4Y9XPT9_9APHY|nr:hypothetical protein EVJ58_g10082 [Rhodofomes roseus]
MHFLKSFYALVIVPGQDGDRKATVTYVIAAPNGGQDWPPAERMEFYESLSMDKWAPSESGNELVRVERAGSSGHTATTSGSRPVITKVDLDEVYDPYTVQHHEGFMESYLPTASGGLWTDIACAHDGRKGFKLGTDGYLVPCGLSSEDIRRGSPAHTMLRTYRTGHGILGYGYGDDAYEMHHNDAAGIDPGALIIRPQTPPPPQAAIRQKKVVSMLKGSAGARVKAELLEAAASLATAPSHRGRAASTTQRASTGSPLKRAASPRKPASTGPATKRASSPGKPPTKRASSPGKPPTKRAASPGKPASAGSPRKRAASPSRPKVQTSVKPVSTPSPKKTAPPGIFPISPQKPASAFLSSPVKRDSSPSPSRASPTRATRSVTRAGLMNLTPEKDLKRRFVRRPDAAVAPDATDAAPVQVVDEPMEVEVEEVQVPVSAPPAFAAPPVLASLPVFMAPFAPSAFTAPVNAYIPPVGAFAALAIDPFASVFAQSVSAPVAGPSRLERTPSIASTAADSDSDSEWSEDSAPTGYRYINLPPGVRPPGLSAGPRMMDHTMSEY